VLPAPRRICSRADPSRLRACHRRRVQRHRTGRVKHTFADFLRASRPSSWRSRRSIAIDPVAVVVGDTEIEPIKIIFTKPGPGCAVQLDEFHAAGT
jgi:hypothetical protein